MNTMTRLVVLVAVVLGVVMTVDAAGRKKKIITSDEVPTEQTFTAADYSQEQFNKRIQTYFANNDFYGLSQYIYGHEIGRAFSKKHGKEMGKLIGTHWENLKAKKNYLGLEKFMYSMDGGRSYTPVLFEVDKEQMRKDFVKTREIQRLLHEWGVGREVFEWQRELQEMRAEIVAWQSKQKASELAAEKDREEAWIEKHEKAYKEKIEPVIEEMEYADALKKFNELINADKSEDDACIEWSKAKAAKIEALWADDLNKNLRARVKEMEEDKKSSEDIVLFAMGYGSDMALSTKVSKLLQAEKMGLVNRLGGKFDEGLVLKEIIKQVDDEVTKSEAGSDDGVRIRTYQRYLKMISAGRLSKIGSEDKNAKMALSAALERGHYFVADKLIALNKEVYDPLQVVWSPDAVEWCMTNQLDVCKSAFDKIIEGDENDINVKCLNSLLRYTRRIEGKQAVLTHWFKSYDGRRRRYRGPCEYFISQYQGLCEYLISQLSSCGKERFLHNVIANGCYFSFDWMRRPCSFELFSKMVETKSINEKFIKMDCAASYLTCTIAFMQQNREGSISREDGLKTIKLLLEKGAPLNVKAKTLVPSASNKPAQVQDVTPLQFAVMIGDKEVVELLLQPEWGANVGEEIDIRCFDSEDNNRRYVRAKSILELCRRLPWEDDRCGTFSAAIYFDYPREDRVKIEKLLIDAGASE